MKKLKVFLVIVFVTLSLVGCGEIESVVRIHIRANSNSINDQEIKMLVKDEIISYITPLIANCENGNDVKNILGKHLEDIESVSDKVLNENNFDYKTKAKINNEFFPTREYDGVKFGADYYDALIVELGSGKGDNWWCVAYPPLCFVGEECEGNEVRYKSVLVELINKFFGR